MNNGYYDLCSVVAIINQHLKSNQCMMAIFVFAFLSICNQTKGAHSAEESREEATCPLYKDRDSQQYWIRGYQAKSLRGTRRDYIALVKGDIMRQGDDKHFKTAIWTEIALAIAVTHPTRSWRMGGDVVTTVQVTTEDKVRKAVIAPTQRNYEPVREGPSIL